MCGCRREAQEQAGSAGAGSAEQEVQEQEQEVQGQEVQGQEAQKQEGQEQERTGGAGKKAGAGSAGADALREHPPSHRPKSPCINAPDLYPLVG